MKSIAKVVVASLVLAGLLTACNTVRGFGEDVSSTGHGIQRAS